uniref:DNA repair metallo-beta-lactamase domain-containing protein n=1 Tax=Fagus sylvatica TaxID=28930 RepID=A0A2N9FT05_FAGSY
MPTKITPLGFPPTPLSLSTLPLLTKTLILQHYPQLDDSLFVGIEDGQSVVVDDPDGAFTVTAFDANHCPGAVMFLFEGNFGNILHTVDCRLTPECLQSLPEKYVGKNGKEPRCQLDYVFLDCTFGRFRQKIPSKHSAIRQVINCIWKHPDAPVVYLTCDLLGQEEILADVSQTFGSKIYVDKASNPECFQALTLTHPEIISEDSSSRFQVLDGFPKLYERAKAMLVEAQANFQPEPLIIRPSTQWYACEEEYSENESQRKLRMNEAVRDQFGVWHVCYSIHSSKEELEWALQLLVPKWVVSTTPTCRAMELDFVKKHCFGNKLASNDPIWKLLDITTEASPSLDVSVKGVSGSTVVENHTQIYAKPQFEPVKVSTGLKGLIKLSPPSKNVTLFGRARLGLQDFSFSHEGSKVVSINIDPPQIAADKVEECSFQEDAEVKCQNSESKTTDHTEVQYQKSVNKEIEVHKNASSLTIGSSKRFSERFRKLYRSMNVPVPQPLPSLVELMKANKCAKRKFEF